MKLNFIDIQGLYGSFKKRVDFNERISLLVGINGSGKTTLLTCIDWMLRPDIARLASTKFDSIDLGFSFQGADYILSANQVGNELIVSRKGGKKLAPIKVFLIHRGHGFGLRGEEARHLYQRMTPEDHETELWKFWTDLPHPLTITLDRSISAETEDSSFFEPIDSHPSRIDRKVKPPLQKVSDVTREKYSAYRKRIFELNEELKDSMVVSAFKNPFDVEKGVLNKKISLAEISKLEKKVSLLLSASLGNEEASLKISKYFSNAKDFARMSANDEKLRQAFWFQFLQIDELTKAFDSYERQSSIAYESLGSYLKALNSFFTDSGKMIGFNENDGTLSFRFVDAEKNVLDAFNTIDRMSSGEKQILILLTFLAFVSEPNQIFVVDEPELSLHPRWQENFLDAVLSQAPPNTQIILATHSPEIVAKHKNSCIVLKA